MKALRSFLVVVVISVIISGCQNQVRNQTFGPIPVILPKMDSIIAVVGQSDSVIVPFKSAKDWSKLVWFTQIGSGVHLKSYDLYSADTTENPIYNTWNLVIRYVGFSRGWTYMTFEPDGFPHGSTVLTFSVIKPEGKVTMW